MTASSSSYGIIHCLSYGCDFIAYFNRVVIARCLYFRKRILFGLFLHDCTIVWAIIRYGSTFLALSCSSCTADQLFCNLHGTYRIKIIYQSYYSSSLRLPQRGLYNKTVCIIMNTVYVTFISIYCYCWWIHYYISHQSAMSTNTVTLHNISKIQIRVWCSE